MFEHIGFEFIDANARSAEVGARMEAYRAAAPDGRWAGRLTPA